MAAETQRPKFVVGIPGQKLEEVERELPPGEPPPLPINEKLKVIGKPTARLDGRLKVTGAARYTADIKLPGMLYGRMLTSTITCGRIKSIDTSAAEAMPGVKAIHILERVRGGAESSDDAGEKYPRIRYQGQPIAAVAAVSPAVAEDACRAIKVVYEPSPFVVDIEKARQPEAPTVFAAPAEQSGTAGGGGGPRGVPQQGNVRGPARSGPPQEELDRALAQADVVVEREYHTQVQTHSALETHGVVADYKPDQLTVWASTQGTLSVRDELAAIFEMPKSKVRVITEFMGAGFGAKFGAGNWGVLAVHLSKKAGAPVHLMCDRKQEQLCTGNRPSSNQKLRIGAKKDGTLTAIHVVNYGTAGTGTGAGASRPAMTMYECPVKVAEEYDVFTHAGPAAAMRAPGHPQGVFSLEQAIDELAEKLEMDPLELRDRIDRHEARRVERRIGAELVNWKNRHKPGADPGPIKRGLGVAQSIWFRGTSRNSAAEVRIAQDGSVQIVSAVQDIGGGIRTALAQIVAEELGLKPADITVRIGDTDLPPGPASGGSVTTNSMAPVARNAAYNAKLALFQQVAPAMGVAPDDLMLADGKLVCRSDPSRSLTFKQAAAKISNEQITGRAERGREYADGPGMGGVQFAEVAVDTQTGIIRVERVVAVHDCGRPVNPLALESQINGGVLQGISYALYEDRILDRQTGFMVNPNLEQYKIVGARETPKIQVHLIEQYWARSSVDAAGIGEPATIPTAAAVANAVYNAIGVRITRLPMTPAVVLDAIARARAATAMGIQG
ncbi:xanthine dehydrogenase family protein molybdopterin-binding subunit [Fontivita pretiosa]|uniref:xanthine dehydrogenase family protein molybdopterin-binding subunit n=1 Tax=Fontivita pretiosa TaxID=2989684 RepID=UPI003D17AC39